MLDRTSEPLTVMQDWGIEDGGFIEMTPAEWAAVPDHPRQRDTVAHASRAKHLRVAHPTHRMVHMIVLPDGRRYKGDGHSRSYLWETGALLAPETLKVQVWLCASLDPAKQLYTTFDNLDAVETGKDKLKGGLRELGIKFESDLLIKGRFIGAMGIAHELMFGDKVSRARDIYDRLAYWAPELKLVDQCKGHANRFHAGTIAAALLTARRFGSGVVPFWTAYAANRGMKIGDEMDGVQALDERITAYIKTGSANGRNNTLKIISTAISAFEHFRRNELYKSGKNGGARALDPRALKTWLITARNTVRGG